VADEDELARRQERGQQINDPGWVNEQLRILHGGDNQAEGQGEAIDDEELEGDEGMAKAEADAVDDDDDD
jgi:RNA polymerase II-associated factor 1